MLKDTISFWVELEILAFARLRAADWCSVKN